MKNEQIDRIYFDVLNNPSAYPATWIKKDGISFWKEVASENPYGEKILNLFLKMVDDGK